MFNTIIFSNNSCLKFGPLAFNVENAQLSCMTVSIGLPWLLKQQCSPPGNTALTPCESLSAPNRARCSGHLPAKVSEKPLPFPRGSFSPVGHLWPGESGLKARPELASSALPTIPPKTLVWYRIPLLLKHVVFSAFWTKSCLILV